MQYIGDYRIDDYITFGCQLHRFSSGAVYAPTGNVTYTFYENNSTTGAPTGGNLAQLNSKTGLYTARVQLTNANGFEAGKEYLIHLEATVDSVAAAKLLMFRIIDNPKVDLDTIKTQSITCSAGVTVLASVGTATTSTAQTGDSYAIVNNGTYGNSAIHTDIGTLTTTVGAAGAGLTAIPTGSIVIENSVTLIEVLRVALAVLAGKSAGGGTGTITMRDNADTLNRVTASCDANGNRTAVTLNLA